MRTTVDFPRRLRIVLAALLAVAVVPLAGPTPEAEAAEPAVTVRAYGFAKPLGAPSGPLAAPIVGMAAHPRVHGYWLLGRDGGIFTYGAARFFGSTGGMRLNQPVVGLAAHPGGNGYWLVASDGGVFTFGSAAFHGSTGAIRLNRPIVGMAPTPRGDGYWLVASDGGVFAFGAARFHGSLGGVNVGSPVVGIETSRTGRGYGIATADGRVYSYGDAPQVHTPARSLRAPVVDVERTKTGRGYWMVTGDGAVLGVGDARSVGDARRPGTRSVALATTPERAGYWIATTPAGPQAPPGSGTGKRVVYSNSQQRVWLVEGTNTVTHSFPVTGKQGVPRPGEYRVFSQSPMSSANNGALLLPYMTRFTWGTSLAIGFHGIPLRSGSRTPIQSDAELGRFGSAGCVRMNQDAARTLYHWAPVGTKVVVIP